MLAAGTGIGAIPAAIAGVLSVSKVLARIGIAITGAVAIISTTVTQVQALNGPGGPDHNRVDHKRVDYNRLDRILLTVSAGICLVVFVGLAVVMWANTPDGWRSDARTVGLPAVVGVVGLVAVIVLARRRPPARRAIRITMASNASRRRPAPGRAELPG